MRELEKILSMVFCKTTQGKDFIRVRCYCEFEGHGRASETWEEHWELVLPMQQAYWKSTKGWKKCRPGLHQVFHGKTFDSVVNMAKQFFIELKSESPSCQ